MALATIGESVVSSIVNRLMDLAFSFLGEKLLPAGDTEAELKRLKYKLPQIKAVLQAVENNQIKAHNEELEAWHWQFREAVERADDVLDEFEYNELEEKVQARNDQESSYLLVGKRKLFNYLRKKFKDDTLTRLVEAVRALDRVVAGVDNFLNLEKHTSGFWGKNYEEYVKRGDDRETGSLLTENVVFGRDMERDLVVEWLTSNSVGEVHGAGNTGSLSAFTILGIGGLGKTTLAQLICKDERVNHYFDQVIWVYVSSNFNAVEIITKILEVITKERPTVCSLASLQENLKEKLATKKFLMVLDDVWNDKNRKQWEDLVAPLKSGHVRSKILVTSRMESVADMAAKVLEGAKDCLKLEGLKENEFLALFNKHAFAGVDPAEFKNLHFIGKQIAKKLGGCPLAAKVMGGVLNYSMEFNYWNKLLKEDVPNFLSGMDDIMIVLRLSYNHLPAHLQVCFRYCSIFPKDYQFKKDELIKMWMGSELIERRHNKYRPEDIGTEYFNCLVRKSFFDLKLEEFAGRFSEHYYVMHDLLHDLAMSVSEGDCLRIEEGFGSIPKTIRHLQFQINHVGSLQEIAHLKNLRTLCIKFGDDNSDYGDMQAFNQILKQFKSLRLLSLSGKYLQAAPDAIGELIHLRYLSLCRFTPMGKQIPWFPSSIYRLYHLEVIIFEDRGNGIFNGIDKSCIYNLIKLRYLDTSYNVCRIPAIGKLSCLQELNIFRVRKESGYRINELGSLKSLCKLCIADLENVNSSQEAKEARLSEKEYLKELDLDWSFSHTLSPEEYYEQLLDSLQPHINLEELRINSYGGSRPPVWMTHQYLVNLTILKLANCSRLLSLPALGKLPLLKHLTLQSLPEVKKLDHTFYGNGQGYSFPVLKELIFMEMIEWEEWVEEEDMIVFPRLETLQLSCCPKLRRLPSLPPSLKELLISDAGIHILPKIFESNTHDPSTKPSSLSILTINYCNSLISLEECLLQQTENIQSLTKINIAHCLNLVYLPSRWFIDLNSLRELSISQCPKLSIASGTQQNLLPSSLQNLSIQNCGLEIPVLGSLRSLTKLKELSLYDCPNLISLPSVDILSQLTSLASLFIENCKELVSLDGLHSVTSLSHLSIKHCNKLVALASSQPLLQTNVSQGFNAHNSSLRLDKLQIAHPSLLNLEPLRSLEWTKELVLVASGSLLPEEWLLQNRSSLQSLTVNDATNLEHLPASIERMQLLETLYIFGAQLIQSLPDLPLSLSGWHLFGCHPSLKEQYKREGSVEWSRVAHIRMVNIE